MIKRITFILSILSLIMVVGFVGHVYAADTTVTLKQGVALDDDYIRVGHIFDNAGDYSSHPLAPTPVAGESLVLNKSDLMRIVNSFNFEWQPDIEQPHSITFTRNATRVSLDDLKDILLGSELNDRVGSDFDIYFDNNVTPLTLKGQDVMSFSTQNIQYNPVTERFSAVVYGFDSHKNIVGQDTITGKAVKMITVPALTNRIRSGAIISQSDVTRLRLREKDLNNTAYIEEKSIIGMEARRSLPSMTPLTNTDLTAPKAIRKNELITISLKKGPMTLTARGRALADGAKGDLIQVMNSSSKKIVEAIVVSNGTAVIPTQDINSATN